MANYTSKAFNDLGKDNDRTYQTLKAKAYPLAAMAAFPKEGPGVYRAIMESSDELPFQGFALSLCNSSLSIKQRRILLDGLAREYASVEGWMEYCDRECEQDKEATNG